jgi:hypothetical protein
LEKQNEMMLEIKRLQEIQAKAMPTTSVIASAQHLVPLTIYPAANLFYCHYCPEAFRTDADRKRHHEKEFADYEKNHMTPTLRPSTRMREPAQDLVNGQPTRKKARPATLIEANDPAAMNDEGGEAAGMDERGRETAPMNEVEGRPEAMEEEGGQAEAMEEVGGQVEAMKEVGDRAVVMDQEEAPLIRPAPEDCDETIRLKRLWQAILTEHRATLFPRIDAYNNAQVCIKCRYNKIINNYY